MQQQFHQKRLDNAQSQRHFILLWFTVSLWAMFLTYMLFFHFQREMFEPLVMKHFQVGTLSDYLFAEIKIFTYILWTCCIVTGLVILNSWGKMCHTHVGTPEIVLILIMLVTVSFALFYAITDLNYLNGQIVFLANYFSH